MNRRQAISEISDEKLPLEKRIQACHSLLDVRDDEPEFETAANTLLRISSSGSLLSKTAGSVLKIIDEKRYLEARGIFLLELERDLQPDEASDPERLVQIFEDADMPWERRRAACRLLGELNPTGAVQTLLGAFNWKGADLAFEAANALFTIHVNLRRPLAEATERLTTVLKQSGDSELEDAAVYALGRLGDSQAQDVLVGVSQDRSLPSKLRRRAVEGLALGPPSAAVKSALIRALHDDEAAIRIAAIGVLNTNSPGVNHELQRLLNDHEVAPGEGAVADAVRSKLGIP